VYVNDISQGAELSSADKAEQAKGERWKDGESCFGQAAEGDRTTQKRRE
jgi:hypothetical protein